MTYWGKLLFSQLLYHIHLPIMLQVWCTLSFLLIAVQQLIELLCINSSL